MSEHMGNAAGTATAYHPQPYCMLSEMRRWSAHRRRMRALVYGSIALLVAVIVTFATKAGAQ